MRRLLPLLASFALLWNGVCSAAPLLPLELPPPDLVPLLPLASPPLDKPPVSFPELPLPDPPEAIPSLPPPPLVIDLSQKPLAPFPPPPGIFGCNPFGELIGGASQLIRCGLVHFQREELQQAEVYLKRAARESSDREAVRQARYWLGQTLFRLNRLEEAERSLRQVYQESSASELGLHALHSLGWLALRLSDPVNALASFEQVIKFSPTPEVIPYARHGRAMALYAEQRYADAREAWQVLSNQRLPAPLVRDVRFWLGETLGRVGEYAAAEEQLRRFTGVGSHPLLETGALRLGWWALAAGRPAEGVQAFRWLLSAHPRSAERAWAQVGLIMALLALDDFPGASEVARQLQATESSHPLVIPSLLRLLRLSVEKGHPAPARALHQELLALNPPPAVRSYVFLLSGEASRREGASGEARAHFELARSIQPGSPLAWRATLRLVQMDLEAREFEGALRVIEALLNQPLSPELRRTALLLHGEAAYWMKSYETAAEAFGRLLAEFPGHPEAGSAVLSLGWAEFRRGRRDVARQRWLDFARSFPRAARAGEALLLVAELTAESGDLGTTQDLLDQFLARFPTHPDTPVARLNRAILELRAGRFQQALTRLRELMKSAPLSPFIGRMRLATGVALLAVESPAEAAGEFSEALKQGEDVLARLGRGSAALAQRQWREAERSFREARDLAGEPVRLLAEYGAAATAFYGGKREEFTRVATTLAESPRAGLLVPRLAYVLAAIAVEERRWAEARQWTLRLVNDFPADQAADDALARLGAGAFAAKEWPLARESYQLLLTRYPQSPHAAESRLELVEALLRTGAPAEALGLIEPFVDSARGDPRLPQALLLLAEAQEATGDRAKAAEALTRLIRDHPRSELAGTAQMRRGRLLQELGRWDDSRRVWEQVVKEGPAEARPEAHFRIGEARRARGLHEEAVEAYMTAAYLAPRTSWGQRALFGAGQSFTALKDSNSAASVYRKLLAQPGVEPELAAEARKALKGLGQSP